MLYPRRLVTSVATTGMIRCSWVLLSHAPDAADSCWIVELKRWLILLSGTGVGLTPDE